MKIFFTALIVALAAFAAGVWYTREYAPAPEPVPQNTPTTTPAIPQATYQNADADMIVVTTPKPGANATSTFMVTGQARGGWYFEASFPLEVRSATGTVLVQMPVQSQGDWMTANFVPFTTQVKLPAGYKGTATLILRNDNPSGLPENDASISIPTTIQ